MRSATAPTFARLQPALAARAKPPSAARVRTRATLHGSPACAVRAGLRAVAAQLHRAPRRRPVRRPVVERPAAVPARLQPRPGSVEHRPEGDRDEPVERIAAVVEPQLRVLVDLQCQPAPCGIDRLDGSGVERQAVVGQRQRAEGLAERRARSGSSTGPCSANQSSSQSMSCSRSMLFTNCCTARNGSGAALGTS